MRATKKKSNNTVKYLFIGVGVLIVLLLVGKFTGLIGGKDKKEIEVADVKPETIVDKVLASGVIEPVVEVKLSPDVSGEVIELNVEEGDSVKKGQVLLKIRPDIYQSQLEQAIAYLNQQKANLLTAEAALSKATAQFEKTQFEYNRNEQLYKEKVISESDKQLTDANYKVALNDKKSAEQNVEATKYVLKSAEASVRSAQQKVRFTTMTAPVDGIVSKLNVKLGERVVGTEMMAGTEILRIADLTKMEARVDVNENDIIRVSLGDSVIVDVDAYAYADRKFKGIVTSIANTANDKQTADAITEFEVKIRLLNDSFKDIINEKKVISPFRPGMTASVEIVTDVKKGVIAIPLSAVTTRKKSELDEKGSKPDKDSVKEASTNVGNKNDEKVEVVFVYDKGIARVKEVKTGSNDFNNIEIVSGLEKGQKIITGPFVIVSKSLKDGDAVTISTEKKKDKTE